MRRGGFVTIGGILLLGLLGAGFSGCKDQEAPRSLVYVSRIAESPTEQSSSGYVFLSDIVGDDGVYEDEVFVSFKNVPRSSHLSIVPNGPYGSVVLTDYRVDYTVTGGSIEAIKPIVGKIHLVIPSGEEVNHRIVLVTAVAKTEAPLSTTVAQGQELMANAALTFTGYEETSEEPIVVRAYITIHFANWVDQQ